ncbi:MAG: hypothetical protein R6U98_02065 [Pirellulaceae bacterium]
MSRLKRGGPAREVLHVLNRAVARLTLFDKPEDYDAFLDVLEETWHWGEVDSLRATSQVLVISRKISPVRG